MGVNVAIARMCQRINGRRGRTCTRRGRKGGAVVGGKPSKAFVYRWPAAGEDKREEGKRRGEITRDVARARDAARHEVAEPRTKRKADDKQQAGASKQRRARAMSAA